MGKRKERLRVGEKESFPGSKHEGLLIIPAVQVVPDKGSTGALEARGDLHSRAMETMKRSDCLFAAGMAGEVQDLAAFGASGQVRKLCLQPLGDTRECPSQNTFCGLKTNFPFHWLFLDLPLSRSDLERES
jgi:hypothetical protein